MTSIATLVAAQQKRLADEHAALPEDPVARVEALRQVAKRRGAEIQLSKTATFNGNMGMVSGEFDPSAPFASMTHQAYVKHLPAIEASLYPSVVAAKKPAPAPTPAPAPRLSREAALGRFNTLLASAEKLNPTKKAL